MAKSMTKEKRKERMAVCVVSRDPAAAARARAAARAYGFGYDAVHPDIVISYGGDGTLLHSERRYPGVPKLQLRNSATCKKCHDHPLERALGLVRQGRYRVESLSKLEARVRLKNGAKRAGPPGNPTLIALNDIILRNKNLARAIRFSLSVDGKELAPLLIGDGLVVATPFGSAAYYHSITGRSFGKGLGIAFNNLTEAKRPFALPENMTVIVRLLRGPAELAADNERLPATLAEGDIVVVRKAKGDARRILLTD